MICPNCGFTNQPGDEFCGNCGTYLGFANELAADGQGQPAGQQGATGQPGAGYPTGSQPSADSPTTVQPVVPPIPPIPQSGGRGTQPVSPSFGRASDIICWNCGRRNPAGRAFCMQCGTKLTSGDISRVSAAPRLHMEFISLEQILQLLQTTIQLQSVRQQVQVRLLVFIHKIREAL